jgi:hypothetical protein
MNKLFSLIAPAAIVLAASLGSGAAHASTSESKDNASTTVVAQTTASDKTQHRLTRRDVYNELVQDEKDGTLARINALYEGS